MDQFILRIKEVKIDPLLGPYMKVSIDGIREDFEWTSFDNLVLYSKDKKIRIRFDKPQITISTEALSVD